VGAQLFGLVQALRGVGRQDYTGAGLDGDAVDKLTEAPLVRLVHFVALGDSERRVDPDEGHRLGKRPIRSIIQSKAGPSTSD
jgi:hypothetical protein